MRHDLSQTDALRLLGLQAGATRAEVDKAYRHRILAAHPDLASDEDDRRRRADDAVRVNLARDLLVAQGTGPARAEPAPEPSTPRPSRPHPRPTPPTAHSTKPRERATARRSAVPQTLRDRTSRATWAAALAAVFVLAGALLRVFHVWDDALAPTAWGDESASMSLAEIAIRAGLGLAGVWLVGLAWPRGATITLMAAVVVYSAFSEVSIRLNFVEEALLFGLLVIWPLYRLVTR